MIKNFLIFISTDDLPHDIFRRYKYPDDELYSFEDTISYFDNLNNCCYSSLDRESMIKRIKEYWKQYPNGMIKFG